MDVRSLTAAQSYSASRPALQPEPAEALPLERQAARQAASFAAELAAAEATAQQAMTGRADPHALVEALAQTELAVETVVSVRDKVVEAYQEILRMPV
jgi:flagellar hook-basal body complex protein FliE